LLDDDIAMLTLAGSCQKLLFISEKKAHMLMLERELEQLSIQFQKLLLKRPLILAFETSEERF
jgi:hypothetical protein